MTDDGNQSVFVGTFLQSGDAVALCDDCLPAFALAVAATQMGIDPGQLATVAFAMVQEAEAAGSDQPEGAEATTPTTAEGAPSDQPPETAPADTDPEAKPTPAEVVGRGGRARPRPGAPPTESNHTTPEAAPATE